MEACDLGHCALHAQRSMCSVLPVHYAIHAPCFMCTMLYVLCVVHARYCMYTELYVPCVACCIGIELYTHCAACAMSLMCIAAPVRCPAIVFVEVFVEAQLAKAQCENHKQQLMLMRTSHRRVSTTTEGRTMFYNEYMEMQITRKPNNFSGICDENERDSLLPD